MPGCAGKLVPLLGAAFVAVFSARAQPVPSTGAAPIPGEVLLLDRALRPERVVLLRLDAAGVWCRDADGSQRARAVDELLALVPAWWMEGTAGAPRDDARPLSLLELTDGQRYPGSPAPPSSRSRGGDPDTVAWVHRDFGRLTVPLDRVRRIVLGPALHGAGAPSAAGVDDTVLLANGDRLHGFVERIGLPGEAGESAAQRGGRAAVVVESGAQRLSIPLERVAEITLANDLTRATGIVAWLADGAVARVDRFGSGVDGRATIELPAELGGGDRPAASLDLDSVSAVAFHAERIRPLASLAVARQEPVGGRRRAEPVRVERPDGVPLGAADVELPGPMLVEWEIPADSERVAGWAVLPPAARVWGDCELVIAVVGAVGGDEGGREVFRQRLHADRPGVGFDLGPEAIGGAARLRVTVEPGEHGPIQDRVVLRRAVVVVDDRGGTD